MRLKKPRLPRAVYVVFTTLAVAAFAVAQDAVEPAPTDVTATSETAATDETVDVLTRGPVHEAFAEPYDHDPQPGIVITKKPPEPITEIPPETMPEGQNVQWISGYWAFDHEQEDFIWISGVWRVTPPGQRWVPGYWADVEEEFQWVSGFWSSAEAEELSYLPLPDESLEQGPTSPEPSDDRFWVPGCWVYRDATYAWRPGFWSRGYADWVWIPSRYIWTPRGCIYANGYWDYPIAHRGLLFAPIYFHSPIYAHAGYYYRPSVVIYSHLLLGHLFIHPHYGHYYFGDFYGHHYASFGIYPWHWYGGHHRRYDPLLRYYGRHPQHFGLHNNARSSDVVAHLKGQHKSFVDRADFRPSHTFKGQADFAKRHGSGSDVRRSMLGGSMQDAVKSRGGDMNFVRLSDKQRGQLSGTTKQLRQFQQQRSRVERALATTDGPGAKSGSAAVRQQRLKLPKVDNSFSSNTVQGNRRGRGSASNRRAITATQNAAGANSALKRGRGSESFRGRSSQFNKSPGSSASGQRLSRSQSSGQRSITPRARSSSPQFSRSPSGGGGRSTAGRSSSGGGRASAGRSSRGPSATSRSSGSRSGGGRSFSGGGGRSGGGRSFSGGGGRGGGGGGRGGGGGGGRGKH